MAGTEFDARAGCVHEAIMHQREDGPLRQRRVRAHRRLGERSERDFPPGGDGQPPQATHDVVSQVVEVHRLPRRHCGRGALASQREQVGHQAPESGRFPRDGGEGIPAGGRVIVCGKGGVGRAADDGDRRPEFVRRIREKAPLLLRDLAVAPEGEGSLLHQFADGAGEAADLVSGACRWQRAEGDDATRDLTRDDVCRTREPADGLEGRRRCDCPHQPAKQQNEGQAHEQGQPELAQALLEGRQGHRDQQADTVGQGLLHDPHRTAHERYCYRPGRVQPQVEVVHEQGCAGIWQSRGNAPVRLVRRHDETIHEDQFRQQVRSGLGGGGELAAVMAEEGLRGMSGFGEFPVEVGACIPAPATSRRRARRRQQDGESRHEQQGETHADAAQRIPHAPSRWGSRV